MSALGFAEVTAFSSDQWLGVRRGAGSNHRRHLAGGLVPWVALVDTSVLEDVTQEPDRLIAAARSLGRIGDTTAVEPLRRFIGRGDLPLEGKFQDSIGQRMKVPKDVAWMLYLATAEALAKLGPPHRSSCSHT